MSSLRVSCFLGLHFHKRLHQGSIFRMHHHLHSFAANMTSEFGCEGKHSDMLMGDIYPDHTCDRQWSKDALSIRCCSMEPEDDWCGKEGKKPMCQK